MQLTLDYDASPVKAYGSCREYVQSRVHQQGVPVKAIAADMDYSPSTLARKLAQGINDSNRFTLDDLELYIVTTDDKEPVKYLAAKYLGSDTEALEQKIAIMAKELELAQQKLRGQR
tara:strand:+ start:12224 stop:12574 length:351 start_codon:yes stop_codon:yes gene_type:complete